MFHQFACDSKHFLEIVKDYCAKEAKAYIETGDEVDMPESIKPLALEMTSYHQKYHKLLKVICDDLPKLV